MSSITERIRKAWNVFRGREPTFQEYSRYGYYEHNSYRPDRIRLTRNNKKSIVSSVYNRIALDVSSVSIKHVRLDEQDRYLYTMETGFNNCLTLDANRDQTARAFIQDYVISMFDEGCAAIVPTVTDDSPLLTSSYDILEMRVGKVIQWYPEHVMVRLYNEDLCRYQDIRVRKDNTAIVENPFYVIMNEPNSTLQRLVRKMNILDAIDEQSGAGKLDLIIQLPYLVKNEVRREQAERRRKDIEMQLAGSKYGIAYTDGTEKITQLNRSVDNNLMKQIEYLQALLFSQLGITESILNGTANEQEMLNYQNRVIEPILSALVDEMKRKFLTKTARTQKQSIMFFREPFKLIPVNNLADLADKFTRNEILTSNEVRQIIGMIPSDDPNADQLRNKNLNQQSQVNQPEPDDESEDYQNEETNMEEPVNEV